MSEEKNESTVIDDHKKMVMMTGNLSDFQLKNLKTWPFLLFDSLESVEINYDFTNIVSDSADVSPGVVQFDFKFKKDTKLNKEETRKQLDTLSLWTKFMFWKETRVDFARSGKKWVF